MAGPRRLVESKAFVGISVDADIPGILQVPERLGKPRGSCAAVDIDERRVSK